MKILFKKYFSFAKGSLDYFFKPRLRNSWGGPFNGQIKRQELFLILAEKFHFNALVETGFFRGTTTEFFLDKTDVPVCACEINPEFYVFGEIRLWKNENVHLSLEDSAIFLEKLGQDKTFPHENIFFYLDAHYFEGTELPLRKEIEIICTHFSKAVIMIDDFKIPHDPGYQYDSYGPSKTLEVNYISDLIHRYELKFFFPGVPSMLETGAKRGCIILTTSDVSEKNFLN